PRASQAQQPAIRVVGYLSTSSADTAALSLSLLRESLKETGFVEGRNVAIEVRWAEGRYELLPALARELVARKVAVIVAIGGPAAQAARRATSTIPIVFQTGTDPVELGLVESLGRPGGNATGISLSVSHLTAKRLELLRELVPNLKSVAYLLD